MQGSTTSRKASRHGSVCAAATCSIVIATSDSCPTGGPLGITANTIPPSIVDTPMSQAGVVSGVIPEMDVLKDFIPIRRVSTPDDIAAACVFLCSDDASSITGQIIDVNGGMYM